MKIYEYKYDKNIIEIKYKDYFYFDKESFCNFKFNNESLMDNICDNITIKLIRTNDINIQKIIEGLAENQKCFFKYDTKGIKVYVNQLVFNNDKRKIVINDDIFIGFVPHEYVKYLRKNKKRILNVKINKIAYKKYKKQKSIIIQITIDNKKNLLPQYC